MNGGDSRPTIQTGIPEQDFSGLKKVLFFHGSFSWNYQQTSSLDIHVY